MIKKPSMRLGIVIATSIVLVPAIAGAESRFEYGKANHDDLIFARQIIAPSTTPAAAPGKVARLVYLNKNGVTLTPGDNNAASNHSTVPTKPTTIAPWEPTATTWNATVACIREVFAPFQISFVESDPGDVPHVEAVFGGSPLQFGMSGTVAGVAPFTRDCSIIENAIVFTFPNVVPQADARGICEIQAQEIAHAFGLDHVMEPADPMTYLEYGKNRSFQNKLSECGEDQSRPCGIGASACRAKQNSVALLDERLGKHPAPVGDTIAPNLSIMSPANNATVSPTFEVNIAVTDNTKVLRATVFIDDVPQGSVTGAPWTLSTPGTLAQGKHQIRIEADDGTNVSRQEITVTVSGENPNTYDVSGGCSAGGGSSGSLAFLGLALAGLVVRRRR